MHHGSRKQSGFTLIELTIVLLITGLVIAGLWVVSSSLFFSQNLNQLEKGIVGTSVRIRNFYRDRKMSGDSASITNANFISLDLIAPELGSNATANTISFSPGFNGPGTVNITYDNGNCNPTKNPSLNNNFAVTLVNITKDACNQLLPRLAGSGGAIQSNGIPVLLVGGTNVITANSFNPAVAEASCADGATVEICFSQ